MFMSEKEATSCFVYGFLLWAERVCKGYDKLLSGKTFPSKGPIWVSCKIPKWVKPVFSTPPPIPKQRRRKKNSQHLSEKR